MFRLKSVYIKDYKNIQDQTFDFSTNTGYIALIGLNGSGKSNLLEAISLIFDELYGIQTTERVNGYSITYEIDRIIYTCTTFDDQNNIIPLDKEGKKIPSSVIACYSGEALRLWDMAYKPYYFGFFYAALHGKDYVPQTIYINKYCWKIALISLLFSLDRDVQQFVKNVLQIDVTNVTIQFTYNDIANPQPHDAYNWLEKVRQQYGINDIPLEELRDFGLGNTLHEEMTEDKLIFFYLYFLHIPKKTTNQPIDKLISTISIKFGSIEFDSLSEGQKKMILIACITRILGDENSLVLLDEPDAHVHIENKKKILETIAQYNGQTILTTHSPIFIDMMNQEDIRYVESGSIVNMDRIKTITKISEGRISILEGALVATAKKMIITEGPDDVKHIKAAISELSNRHLDYAKLSRIPITFQGGAKLVNEYYESIIKPVYNNLEKIVFVFDYDSEGREGAKLVEKLQLEKITYVYYYDNYPIAQNAHDFFLEDFYPRTIYPDIQLPQIQKEPTFYEMKKCSTLTNSVKSRLQKMIKDGELKGTNFDGYVNFLNQLVTIFNPLL